MEITPPSLLLPVEYGLSRKILVSARRMTEELRQRLDISGVRNESAFEIPLKHHSDVECRPGWSPLPHLLLERIHVVPGVINLLAQQPTPDRCQLRTTQHLRTVKIVGLAIVSVGGQRNRCSLSNIPYVNCRDAYQA